MGFFAVMNPIANTPIFPDLVEGTDKATKAKVGPNLILVLGKIMGLILTIIGMDMITTGIKPSFNL